VTRADAGAAAGTLENSVRQCLLLVRRIDYVVLWLATDFDARKVVDAVKLPFLTLQLFVDNLRRSLGRFLVEGWLYVWHEMSSFRYQLLVRGSCEWCLSRSPPPLETPAA
jgi:hypothetical protein